MYMFILNCKVYVYFVIIMVFVIVGKIDRVFWICLKVLY